MFVCLSVCVSVMVWNAGRQIFLSRYRFLIFLTNTKVCPTILCLSLFLSASWDTACHCAEVFCFLNALLCKGKCRPWMMLKVLWLHFCVTFLHWLSEIERGRSYSAISSCFFGCVCVGGDERGKEKGVRTQIRPLKTVPQQIELDWTESE